jgi:peptide deformylase
MKKLEILTGSDNAILRAKAGKVLAFDSKLKALSNTMKKTMKDSNGIGLACPQIGKSIRMFIMIYNFKKADEKILTVINPEILSMSEEVCVDEEGCLSLPGIWKKVSRPSEITVRFYDLNGALMKMTLNGLNAREFLHEYDHLDGVLFVDRVEEGVLEVA